MKKIFLVLFIFSALSLVFSGCLKDKGFENNEYGINDPDNSPSGVGFPLGAHAKNTVGLDVSSSVQTINDVIYVNLESGAVAPNDVHITLQVTSSQLVGDYNTANGTSILVMDPSLYNIPTLALTIPKGSRNVQVPINIPNTTALDPNKSYGVGLTISSVDGGNLIASNLKNLLIEFNIKNKYDGKYNLKGFHNRVPYNAPYDETVLMITTGPNSVSMYWPALGAYAHPIAGGASYYGNFTTNFYFDLSTNLLTGWDLTPYPTTVTPSVGPATDSRYDPVTKKIYAQFYYNNNPTARGFTDTLTYLGPR